MVLPDDLGTNEAVGKFGPAKYYDAENPLPVSYVSGQRVEVVVEKVLEALFWHFGARCAGSARRFGSPTDIATRRPGCRVPRRW
jgi:hypothetical protein